MSIKLIIVARRYLPYLDGVRRFSVRSASTYLTNNEDNLIKKSVFISQSTDVFVNLAMEHWLYQNSDFSKHHVLFLWKNDPCVVFGRHQNPWLECNVCEAEKKNVSLARRNSGGGTVYHDRGNLNLTFFTPKEKYDRKYNLEIIKKTLFRGWGIRSEINKRDDIVIDGNKISGTAAKLGKTNAYHHCSLLVDVNKTNLSSILESKKNDIVTNATTSTHSTIKNLSDVNPSIQMDHLVSALGWEYMNTKTFENEKYDLIHQQRGMKYINPTEDWFPGINTFINEFRSWNWNFGKTPKFTIIRTFHIPENKMHRISLRLEVQNGIVEEIKMRLPPELISTNFDQDATVISNLCGTRYSHELTEIIITEISGKMSNMNQVDKDNIRRFDKATLQ